MTNHEIEILKLQMQRDLQDQQAKERRELRRQDLFKWFVAFVWPFIVNVATAYVNNRSIVDVSTKAETAATMAQATRQQILTQTEKDAKAVAALTALSLDTNATQQQWRAEHTGTRVDKAKADERKRLIDESPMSTSTIDPEKVITALKPPQ